MYLCQQLEQISDPRYRRDWRVVWFKVVLTPENTLVWRRHDTGKWRGSGWWGRAGRERRWIDGRPRAEKDLRKNVPIWSSVHHGSKVTGKQAETLTNIRNPYGLDRLMEAGDELTMPELCNYVLKKVKPTKVELLTKRLVRVNELLDESTRLAARMERRRVKWERAAKRIERQIGKLTGTTAENDKLKQECFGKFDGS